MKLEGKYGIGNLVKIFLEICMILLFLVLIFLYNISNLLGLKFDIFIISIYPCGIGMLILIYQFIMMFETIQKNTPFCRKNTVRLKNSMIVCLIISLIVFLDFFLTTFMYNYYSLQLNYCILFISILFFGVAIALYILYHLFELAVKYKEENDLTI